MSKNAQTTAQQHSSHDNKVILKILQARLQQYGSHELPDAQAGFRKRRGKFAKEIKLKISVGSLKKQESSRENNYFCFIDYVKAFDCVDHSKMWKMLKKWSGNTRASYLPPDKAVSVRTGHGTRDWFQTGKGVHQSCILSPACLTYMESTSCDIQAG